ncbi:MAG: hypothetical protein ABMB14_33835 [Myxococcota bacterium]
MLTASLEVIGARASRLADGLVARGVDAAVVRTRGYAGGGAMPGQELPSVGVRVAVGGSVDAAARALRVGSPAVVARIEDGALLFDARTVDDDRIEVLADRVAQVAPRV